MVAGKRLLDSLEEQKTYVFVSEQIADEVLRNKLGCAQSFFSDKLKVAIQIPDHLLGITDHETAELRKTIEEARNKLTNLVAEALARISRSEDERLGALFDKAVSPSPDELQRARERKERGNPPRKPKDPLGDQITWEQLLSHCKESKSTGLWIITRDSDYYINHDNKLLLNSFLMCNLINSCGVALEIHCHDNLLKGITHFGRNAGVTAEKLPTAEEAAVIEKEIDALPPLGWLTDTDEAVREAILFRNRNIAALQARSTSSVGTLWVAPVYPHLGAIQPRHQIKFVKSR